jgi:transcriptional regulator with XRE-family HTH domain
MTDLDPLIVELHARRLSWGVSRDILARTIGCSYESLRRWETGSRPPGLPILHRWAGALGCDVLLVYHGQEEADDWVAVDRAVDGERLTLTPRDRVLVVRRLTRAGKSAADIARIVESSTRQVIRDRNTTLPHSGGIKEEGTA